MRLPPAHMPVEYGPVKAVKAKGSSTEGVKVKGLGEAAEVKVTAALSPRGVC